MDSKIDTAWNLFLEGKISEAKKLVEQDFSIDTCTDFSLLNLMGYLLLAEKDYVSCTHIFEKYILLAQQNEDKENDIRYYQYTAIDEYSRQRVVMATKEHSTYESAKFVRLIIKKFKFNIEIIQTDNGFEFTNRLSYTADRSTKTFFEKELEINGIKHKLIKPRTPKQNGKVERSHRKDQENLYYDQKFLNFEDFKRKYGY